MNHHAFSQAFHKLCFHELYRQGALTSHPQWEPSCRRHYTCKSPGRQILLSCGTGRHDPPSKIWANELKNTWHGNAFFPQLNGGRSQRRPAFPYTSQITLKSDLNMNIWSVLRSWHRGFRPTGPCHAPGFPRRHVIHLCHYVSLQALFIDIATDVYHVEWQAQDQCLQAVLQKMCWFFLIQKKVLKGNRRGNHHKQHQLSTLKDFGFPLSILCLTCWET